MIKLKKCPTCNCRLEKITDEEKKLIPKKFDDEDVYWCPSCKEYLLEEDILFNPEN